MLNRSNRTHRRAFTLVELLVVIGIIALLIALLLPSLNKARSYSKKIKCASNLKQLGNDLLIYSNDNRGWLVPVGGYGEDDFGNINPNLHRYKSLGTNVAPPLRWPMVISKLQVPQFDAKAIQDAYLAAGRPNDPIQFPVAPYTPKTMQCPADLDEPVEAHSYVINKHLAKEPGDVKKYSSKLGKGLSSSDVVLIGEKRPDVRDYYLEKENYSDPMSMSEFMNVVEQFRHGTVYGSNYLFMDMHVASKLPDAAFGVIDPWDPPSTTQPDPNPLNPIQ